MEQLISTIRNLPDLKYTGGVAEDIISEAEATLKLTFAEDYKCYLRNFGQVEANGVELSGISNKLLTSVIRQTQQERSILSIPPSHYVIENIGIDGIIYTQDNSGRIYQLQPNKPIIVFSDSLLEYLQILNR